MLWNNMPRTPVIWKQLRHLGWWETAPLLALFLLALGAPSAAQTAAPPVSYNSVAQLNSMLSQLEQTSQGTLVDLAKMRIEKWKTDSNSKREAQGNVESLQRNLQSALPAIIGELRSSPENLTSTFKLYRNLDALYDVFSSVVESAGAFGSKDEFQSLENDLSVFEHSRRSFADRMETLTGAKEGELARLRVQIQSAQAAAATPPKRVIVDDTTPVKKPSPKKKTPPAAKPAPAPPPQPQAQ